jgi:hypothetical protein
LCRLWKRQPIAIKGVAKMNDLNAVVERWLEHIRALAVGIGPRGSTTPAEERAAEYVRDVLTGLGANPQVEAFTSSKSGWLPYTLVTLLGLVGLVIYPLEPPLTRWIGWVLATVAVVCGFLELNLIPNPVRWLLPKGRSQNVYGVIEPANGATQDLLLVGHLDTHRTPLTHRSQAGLAFYELMVKLGFVSLLLLSLLYLVGAVSGWSWVWPVSLAPGIFVAITFLVTAHVDFTDFTPGASDNASGTGLALALAERAIRQPLRRTRLWAVAVGCEEVGMYGSFAFYRRHGAELTDGHVITLDNLGIAGPAWILHEGLNLQFYSHPDLVALAQRIADESPELGAFPQKWDIAYTDSAPAIKAGLKTITLLGATPEKKLPYWHVPEDTMDKLRPDVLAHTAEFAWRMVRAIDEAAE